MSAGQIDNYVPKYTNVLRSEFEKNLEDSNLSILTVNTLTITGKIADLITKLNLGKNLFILFNNH